MFSELKNDIYTWQGLVGSFVGAFAPIMLYLLKVWYDRRAENKENISALEQNIVLSINSLSEAKKTITRLIDVTIPKVIAEVKANDSKNLHSVNAAFFPLFSVQKIDSKFARVNFKSGYLTNNAMHIFSLMEDFAIIVEDLKRQFEKVVDQQQLLALGNFNSAHAQNSLYIDNLEAYVEMVKRDILENNILVCMKRLMYTKEAAIVLWTKGFFIWNLKFSHKYKFFFSKKDLEDYKLAGQDRVEQYLKPEVERKLKEVE